ncbi:hypothetical protein BZA05DRAFT_400680 [Tricharina praecox]|uniref:uncharacterized protein n=1 Tax=Tricharina praecox TaxID=43433 RepID=UPI002220D8AE|nr:uncharacterized protein BZA05DRAFT_400680 [Tricharina praecox]KAI5850030.1 hypothetical protein BZA05DRAFT_400680 [Tricharina praecox]
MISVKALGTEGARRQRRLGTSVVTTSVFLSLFSITTSHQFVSLIITLFISLFISLNQFLSSSPCISTATLRFL